MRLTFQADRHQNVYHSLQEVKDFKKAQWIFQEVDELVSTMKCCDEGEIDWARTLPGKVIVSDGNILSPYGIRFAEAELNFDKQQGTSDLTAELYQQDRSKPNIKVQAQQRGDDQTIQYVEGNQSYQLAKNVKTGVFTITDE